MNKKIIMLALALALPLTASAFPGDKGGPGWHHANRLEHLSKNLDLNAEQKTKLEAIFKEEDEKLKAIHEETQKRLKEILTPEQVTKFDELKKQGHGKWHKKQEALKDQAAPEPKK